MAIFSISGTDFGIDRLKSIAQLALRDDGSRVLTLDVTGDETLYRKVADSEESEWDWSLYPPRFYLVDYNLAPRDQHGHSVITLAPEDYDRYDVALYMMEHNEVSAIKIEMHENSEVSVSGAVDLFGSIKGFEIRCKLEGADNW